MFPSASRFNKAAFMSIGKTLPIGSKLLYNDKDDLSLMQVQTLGTASRMPTIAALAGFISKSLDDLCGFDRCQLVYDDDSSCSSNEAGRYHRLNEPGLQPTTSAGYFGAPIHPRLRQPVT